MGDKVDGGAAFPTGLTPGHYSQEGMSLRDWFAGQIIAATTVNGTTTSWDDDAKRAYQAADAMLAARGAE